MNAMMKTYRTTAIALAALCILTTAGCSSQPGAPSTVDQQSSTPMSNQPKAGMSTKKKLILVAGAALLYYLYKKHQAAAQNGGNAAGHPQLYRSSNGGIYYRDANHNPIWLTVPQQGMQVPASDVQQYAPDYQNYSQQAPPAPQGYRTQPFNNYDPSINQ